MEHPVLGADRFDYFVRSRDPSDTDLHTAHQLPGILSSLRRNHLDYCGRPRDTLPQHQRPDACRTVLVRSARDSRPNLAHPLRCDCVRRDFGMAQPREQFVLIETTRYRDGRVARRGWRDAVGRTLGPGIVDCVHGPGTELFRWPNECNRMGSRGRRAHHTLPWRTHNSGADDILRAGAHHLRTYGPSFGDTLLPPRGGRVVERRSLPRVR